MYDAIIVGGGPAGISAALVLGRCCRQTALFDTGMPRNRKSDAMHSFISRDGINPLEFLKISRKDLVQYPIDCFDNEIVQIGQDKNLFWVEDNSGKRILAKKLLLATGLNDNLPQIKGFDDFYGKSIHHCPYCDGWESRNSKLLAYGKGKAGLAIALMLSHWCNDVILCTDGASHLNTQQKQILKEKCIPLTTKKIKELVGKKGQLNEILFEDGTTLERNKMFFSTGYYQSATLAYQLSCRTKKKGREIWVNRLQMSSINGLYICGDAAFDMKMAIIAAAEGTKAAIAINIALLRDEGLHVE